MKNKDEISASADRPFGRQGFDTVEDARLDAIHHDYGDAVIVKRAPTVEFLRTEGDFAWISSIAYAERLARSAGVEILS
jgi:hypothetical protein